MPIDPRISARRVAKSLIFQELLIRSSQRFPGAPGAGSSRIHGLVEIRRGKGTFVSQPKITQELTELTDLTGFVEDMRLLGRNPTAVCSTNGSLPPANRSRVTSI